MRSVFLFLLTCAIAAAPAAAQDYRLRLPELPLAEALNQLSEQTATVIMAEAGDLPDVRTPRLDGEMTVSEALGRLLAGTGVTFSSDVEGVWVLRAAPAKAEDTPAPQPAERPDRVQVSAFQMPVDVIRVYDTVIVTGSRAGLPAIESMSPVEVLGRTDLAAPVSDDFGDVLAELVPSFFVQRRPLSDGAVFVRPYSLRNLSADHTLVLVNGKRRHRSAMLNPGGSQSSDLSKIPTNALERVEILRDGASAQYGSDAIAGVINFITRSDAAPEAYAQYSQYYEGDGAQTRFGFGGGGRAADGGFRVNFDYSNAAATSRARQRLDALEYLAAHPDAEIANPVQKWGQPEREDFRTLVTADHETGLGQIYGFAGFSWGQGVSDFNWRSPDAPSAYTESDAFGDWSLLDVYPYGFKPQFGQDEQDASGTLGLKGRTDAGLSYDLSLSAGGNRIDYFLYDTINASIGPDSPYSFDAGGLRQREYNLNADFQTELAKLPLFGKPASFAFGFEHRLERYSIEAGDPASYQIGPGAVDGLTSGSNGFPGYTPLQARTYDQKSWAAYVDTEVRPDDATRLGFAARYESFETFGSRLSGKLSLRRDLSRAVMLRATASTGFKAPTPAQLYSERTSQGVDPGTLDIFTTGRFTPTGPVGDIISQRDGADIQSLRPETSTNYSAGLVWHPGADLVASIDAYNITVRNRIFSSENYTLTADERARLAALGVPGGESITTVSFYQNDFDTRTSGVDVSLNHEREFAGGDLNLRLSYNYNTTDVLNASFIDNPSRVARFEQLYPQDSTVASAQYRRSRVTLDGRLRLIGPWADYTNQDGDFVQEFGSVLLVDASVTIDLTEKATLRIGAENLFDAYPDEATLEASKGLIYSRNAPYDTDGGLYYIRLSTKL